MIYFYSLEDYYANIIKLYFIFQCNNELSCPLQCFKHPSSASAQYITLVPTMSFPWVFFHSNCTLIHAVDLLFLLTKFNLIRVSMIFFP